MKYLKKLFTLLVIALFACGFAACSSDDEEPEERSLEVTPANLHGTWKLAEWNGEPLAEGTTATSFSTARTRLSRCIRSLTVCMVAISLVRSLSRTIHTRATSSAEAMITVRATGTRVIS